MRTLKFRPQSLLSKIFIDGVWLHKYWHCHRLPERSFSLQGRQFHVCARCTGLICGAPVGVGLAVLTPAAWGLFLPALLILLMDGFTQLVGWRTSNNILRLLTGLSVSSLFFTYLLHILRTI